VNQIKVGNRYIGSSYPVFIIAEIGINHQGDKDIAKNLIRKAKESGADAVKFQKRSVDRILSSEGMSMPYQNKNSFGKTYGEHKKALELSNESYFEIKEYADSIDILFSASGWDEESVDLLDTLDIPFFKIASADLTNFPLIKHTASKGKPVIVSTGMADMEIVSEAVNIISGINDSVAILQCTSTYPSRYNELHLNVINTYKSMFPSCPIGFSGHEPGIAVPIAAVALGAKIIEKHLTLDRTMKGGDHAASLEPHGFSKMVRDIRNIELSMGNSDKMIQESERSVLKKLGKSIVSAYKIKSGEIISNDMVTVKGPGTGISPMHIEKVIGKKAANDINADTVIIEEDIVDFR